jgi:ABC-2 type transport system ATP-binding protein
VISRGKLIAESTVDEIRGQAGVLIVADPVDQARVHAEKLVGADNVDMADGALRLRTAPTESAWINRELVMAGVSVSELRPVERTLEEVFLELTGAEVGHEG